MMKKIIKENDNVSLIENMDENKYHMAICNDYCLLLVHNKDFFRWMDLKNCRVIGSSDYSNKKDAIEERLDMVGYRIYESDDFCEISKYFEDWKEEVGIFDYTPPK